MSSYEPLFLKYRPQALSDVLGQSSVKETLINAINNQKIVHAYLLTGPRGSGKTSTARILAKSLNCTSSLDGKSPSSEPCGKCESCVSIANSSSIDVTEIDAASHGHVEDARKLIEKVNLASVAGKYRVYIIDEVHMLSNSAFNALLKVIEEPPANVVFVLATTEVDKVPKTIASRCQQLRFKPISPLDCLERLEYVAKQENINIDKKALEIIAAHADGAMRDALSLLDQLSVFSETDKAVSEDRVLEIIGAVPSEELRELTQSILLRNPEDLINRLNALLAKGKDAINLVQELSAYLLDLLEELGAKTPSEKFAGMIASVKEFGIENYELVQILDSLTELEVRMKQSVQNKNLLRAWLIKICHRADILVAKDLLERVKKLESGQVVTPKQAQPVAEIRKPAQPVAPRTVAIQESKPVIDSPAKPVESNNLRSSDSGFLDYLSPGSKGMFVSSQAQLVKVEANTAHIQMPNKFSFLKSKLEARKDEFLTAISKDKNTQVTNFNIELVDEISKPAIQESASAKQTIRVKSFEEAELTGATDQTPRVSSKETTLNEAVDSALSIFGGKEIKS